MAHVIAMSNGSMRLENDGRAEITVIDEGEKRVIRLTRSQMMALMESYAPMEQQRRQVEAMHAQILRSKR